VNGPLPSHEPIKVDPSLVVYRHDLAIEYDLYPGQLGTEVPPQFLETRKDVPFLGVERTALTRQVDLFRSP
jgi:hypothetical protein